MKKNTMAAPEMSIFDMLPKKSPKIVPLLPKSHGIIKDMEGAGATDAVKTLVVKQFTGGKNEAYKEFYILDENKDKACDALRELFDNQCLDCILIIAKEKGLSSIHTAAAMAAFFKPLCEATGVEEEQLFEWFKMAYRKEIDGIFEGGFQCEVKV